MIRKSILNLFFILSLLKLQISFAETLEISNHKLLEVKISNFAPTRISFENQKIVDVFFYPEEAAKVILYKLGIVFVVPNKDNKAVYVTVSTEKGEIQDLCLRFKEIEPRPIELTHAKTIDEQKYNYEVVNLPFRSDYINSETNQLISQITILPEISFKDPKKRLKFESVP
jgi:hypothetical protein